MQARLDGLNDIVVALEQGSAGFAAHEDLRIKRVDPGGACDQAGVQVGMTLVAFQGQDVEPGTTWAAMRALVKSTQRPWAFKFRPPQGATPAPDARQELGQLALAH